MVSLVISFFTVMLTCCYVSVVLFLRRGWMRIPSYRTSSKQPETRVSILIAARNEEDKIGKTIADILLQTYPPHLMELIVVDDHSTDRTADIVRSYANKGVKLILLNEDEPLNSYKKKPLQRL